MDIVKRDPIRNLFAWPRFLEDWDEPTGIQRGLKLRETAKNIIAEAVVAGVPSDKVEVEIEDGILTIKAENKEETSDKDEFKSSSYQYYYTAALSGGEWNKAKAEAKPLVYAAIGL